jgi:uncharacterized membrane protein
MISAFANILPEFAGTMIAGLIVAVVVYRLRIRIQDWTKRRTRNVTAQPAPRVFLGFILIAYIGTFSTLSLLKHINFHTHNDLAIHAQVMWNTSQGRWFDTTLLEDRPTNYLGHHFSPALLLLMPLYHLWPDAALLLVVQAVLLALAVIPIYLYAQRQTGSEMVAISLSVAYLLFPALQYTNLFDFHEIVLGVPLLSFTGYWLLTRRYRLFFVFLVLSLLVKEEMTFVAVAFALYILLVQERYRLGAIVLVVAIGWGYLIMGIAMPAVAGDSYFPTGRYEYLGASFGESARSLLLRPLLVLQHLLIPAKLEFVLHLLVPLGLLPLLGFDTLILALPTMLYLLLSDYEPQYSIHYHYAAPLIPLLFLACVTGIERLIRWRGRPLAIAVSALIVVTSSTSYLLHSPGPLARHFNQDSQYTLWPHLASGYEGLAAIPPEANVMTIEEFAPHLAAREWIYIENESYLPVEYIFQEHAARTATPRYPAFVPEGRAMIYPYYETVFDKNGYWVRRYQDSVPLSNELGVSFEDRLTLLAYQWRDQGGISSSVVQPDGYLDLILAWRAEQQMPERYTFFVHLLDQDSHRWTQVDQEVERGVYPTTLWEPGMVVADHYRLSVPWGTPPGEYQVLLGAYSTDTGQRLRPICVEEAWVDNAFILGSIQVAKPTSASPPEAVSPQHRLDTRLNEELELVGFDLGTTRVQPGQTIPLILIWRGLSEVTDDYLMSLRLQQLDGPAEHSWLEEPAGGTYPTSRWEDAEIVRDWHDLALPADVPPGNYQLSLRLLNARGRAVGREVKLETLTVEGRERIFYAPQIQNTMEARLGEHAAFLGYDLSPAVISPGQSIHLTLYWKALSEPERSYSVFTHLLDSDQRIWGQRDGVPGHGALPTTSWIEREIIIDEYEIVADAEAPPGEYVIEIGMYDANTGQRLPVFDDDQMLEGDRLLLGVVQVVP